jgi:hypothetical protein
MTGVKPRVAARVGAAWVGAAWVGGIVLLASMRCVATEPPASEPIILAHYMPWYQAKPSSDSWGWHWTMNAYDPDRIDDGQRQIASHLYPLIGPYDSGDLDVLEFHLLTMKIAGIDGVIVDWYGLQDFRDYPLLHRNTQRLIDVAGRLEMKFAICYEDQTIAALVEAERITPSQRVSHAASEIEWLAKHWFALEHYVHLDELPVLLSFGQSGLTDEEWSECLERSGAPVAYFSEHHRRSAAVGAFDWPVPNEGMQAVARFQKESRQWSHAIPVAFPRFIDVYAEAKVHASWGRIEDDDGRTFQNSMKQALTAASPLVQIASWNDWGEGTSIEPSRQFDYRDLEVLQQLRRQHVELQFAAAAPDLRLPLELLRLRRSAGDPQHEQQCERIAQLLATGRYAKAGEELGSSRRKQKPRLPSSSRGRM